MSSLPELFRVTNGAVSLTWSGEAATGVPGTLVVAVPRYGRAPVVVVNGSERPAGLVLGPALCEDREFVVWVEATSGRVDLQHRDRNITTRLSRREDGRVLHGTIGFRSAAGLADFDVLLDGRLALTLTVEVFPTKLDYRSDFRQMLADVQAVATGLAIDLLSATYLPATPVSRNQLPSGAEWVAILESMLAELELAFQQIDRAPIWALEHEPSLEPLHRVRRTTPAVRRGVVARGVVQRADGQYLFDASRRVQAQMPHPGLDGPEHRWLRQRLRLVLRRLGDLARSIGSQSPYAGPRMVAVREHLGKVARRVEPLLAARSLGDTNGAVAASFASLALMTRPGYREAYRILTMLDRGLRLEGPAVRADLRDIAALYEYWCFLSLVRMASEVLGGRPAEQSIVRLEARGVRVDLARGRGSVVRFRRADGLQVELAYNREFQSSESVLFDQKPDVVISFRDQYNRELSLVIDAKYRVERVDSPARFGMVAPPEDAVNALYRYRDAVVGSSGVRTVVEAAAAFPASDLESRGYADSSLRRAITKFGVGAIPFLPGNETHMEEWLRSALTRAGWETADRSPGHIATILTEQEEALGGRITLVDVVPARDRKERLDYFASRHHYIPLRPRSTDSVEASRGQRRRLSAACIALYDGKSVSVVADVIGVSVVRRKEIPTPYSSSLPGDALCVLYDLAKPEPINRPITVRSPLVSARWTSRLSLNLAVSTDELLVETVDEWRLLRALRSRRVEPELRRAAISEGRTGGHVSFCHGDWRVVQRALGDWSVFRGEVESRAGSVHEVLSRLGLDGAPVPDAP